jgi:putative protease
MEVITRVCRAHGVLSYLTVNTVVFNHEIEEVHAILDAAKQHGVSAIIASDWAVINYCRQIGLEIHISTQCNVTNFTAVQFYAQFADVIVLAREVNLLQVAEISEAIARQNLCGPSGKRIRLEMFVHGALCMATSGKCYLSLDHFNSSANRGGCYQLCRRGYRVKDMDNEVELDIQNQYIMSPKDLCTIGFLDQLLAAGVSVLKIEGRGRSAEYVKTVTSCYQEAVNAIETGSYNTQKIEAWTARLRSVYNRDFWDGYYLGQKLGEWSDVYGSRATRSKQYIGKVTNYFHHIGVAEITIETGTLSVGDPLLITGTTTGVYEEIIPEIRVDLQPVTTAKKGLPCSIPTCEIVRRGDKVYKWIDAEK